MDSFSMGRTDDTVRVKITRRIILPGGALHLPGQYLSLDALTARSLIEDEYAEPATPPKALDAAPRDTMQHRPGYKKGQA
jgi:hypothetical protein